ncbi:MAG: hypothetical protein ACE5H3_03825, partial [Planctomycetota bacterium]
ARAPAASVRGETLELDTEAIKAGILAATGRSIGTQTAPSSDQDARPSRPVPLSELQRRLEPHTDAIIEALIARATEGEPGALRLVVERMWPSLGTGATLAPNGTLLARVQRVVQAFENEELGPAQAETMLRSLLIEPQVR